MNLKASIGYQLRSSGKALAIFYGVIYAIIAVAAIVAVSTDGQLGVAGLETSTTVFMGFLGVFTFSEDFRFLIQNGYSRKSMLRSFLCQFAVVSLLAAAIDVLNSRLLLPLWGYRSTFTQLYGQSQLPGLIWQLLWGCSLYFAIATITYFMAALYQRLGRLQRLLFMLILPLAVLVLFPVLDFQLLGGTATRWLLKVLSQALGFAEGGLQMGLPVLFFLAISAVFSVFSYLATRRASVS